MTILKYTLAMLLLGLLPFFAQAQDYYIQKDDAGLNTAPYQDSLEQHAKDLVFAIPEGPLRDAFRVYGFGFYQHSEVTDGYPAAFEKMRTQIASETPYYLIFGKQTDKSGVYTRFWVDLKLPEGGCFDKLRAFEKDAFILTFKTYIDDQYVVLEKSASNYASAEMKGIDSLKSLIIQIIDCCNNPNKSGGSCLPCPENSTILTWLLENDFIGVPCQVNNLPSFGLYPNVINYSSKSILTVNIFQNLALAVASLPSSSSGAAKCYVTDNDNICLNSMFDSVNVKYSENLNDHDLWMHFWVGDDGKSYLFARTEQYMLADDEDFFPDEIIAAKQSNGVEMTTENLWLMIDTQQDDLYLADAPMALPVSHFIEPGPFDDYVFHEVQAGESFSSIAEDSEGTFTAAELAAWNKLQLTSIIHPGDKLVLFPNSYFLSESEDDWSCGISVPLCKPAEIGSKYKFLTTDPKLYEFSISNPDLELNNHPPYILRVGGLSPRYEKSLPSVLPETKVILPDPTPEKSKMIRAIWISPNTGVWLLRGAGVIALVVLTPASLGNNDTPIHIVELQEQLKREEALRALYKPLIETSPNKTPKDGEYGYFVTYTKRQTGKTHTKTPRPIETDISMFTTKTYVGRARGVNTPKNIVKIRNYGHHKNQLAGYTKYGCLDKAVKISTKKVEVQAERRADLGYQAIRGREQNVMDDVGKPFSMISEDDKQKRTRSGNDINGISLKNPSRLLWITIARTLWGSVPFSWEQICTP
jgi:LysM domain